MPTGAFVSEMARRPAAILTTVYTVARLRASPNPKALVFLPCSKEHSLHLERCGIMRVVGTRHVQSYAQQGSRAVTQPTSSG